MHFIHMHACAHIRELPENIVREIALSRVDRRSKEATRATYFVLAIFRARYERILPERSHVTCTGQSAIIARRVSSISATARATILINGERI